MLRQRLPSAIGVVVVAVVPSLLGQPILGLAVAALAVLSIVEFSRAVSERGIVALVWFCSAVATVLIGIASVGGSFAVLFGTFVAASLLMFPAVMIRATTENATRTYSYSLMAVVYIGLPLIHLPLLRDLNGGDAAAWLETLNDLALMDHPATGLGWLILVVAATWMTDSAAYLGGRSFGTRQMAPVLSPKKTIEGAACGVVIGTLTGAFAIWLMDLSLPIYIGALLGLILSIIGQLGDLAESLIKRDLGIKDMGNLIPGHGGMLDRIDALLFTLPAGYYLLLLSLEVSWP